ncbi:MAG: hypothetical protein WC869_17055 [Phycisphaerae bacterium]|jgi:hypothetical protein
MPIASNASNIRINGTGRLYISDVGSANIGLEIGEMDGLSDNISQAEGEKIYSNRQAGKLVIGIADGETEGSVTFGMRESSIENMEIAYAADPADVTSQLAGALDAVEKALVLKQYIDVGKASCFVTKIGLGAVTNGPFVAGDAVIQGAVTADVAWVGDGFLELINVNGTFLSGVNVVRAGVAPQPTAAVSTVEKKVDMVVCNLAIPTIRYALETDYRVDADYGFIMKMPESTIGATAFISCDHAALSKQTIYPMSNAGVEKKLTFVSDANDRGPRMRITYFRAVPKISGDSQKIGSGEQVLPMVCTLMADTSRPVGQQFYSIELME